MALNFNSFLDTSIPRVYFKNITVKSVPVRPPTVYGQPVSDTYKNIALEIESFIVIDREMAKTITDNKLLDVYYAVISNADPEFDTKLANGKYTFDQFNSLVRESNGTTIPIGSTITGEIPATDIYLKTVNAESFLSDSESDYDPEALFDSGISDYNNLFFQNSEFTMYKYNFVMNCSVKKQDTLYMVAMFVGQEPQEVEATSYFDPIRQLYGPVCAELVLNKNMRIPNLGQGNYLLDSQTNTVWAGSTHSHQNSLMAGIVHTNTRHASLTQAPTPLIYKILDARGEMEAGLQEGISLTYTTSNIEEPIDLFDPSGQLTIESVIK